MKTPQSGTGGSSVVDDTERRWGVASFLMAKKNTTDQPLVGLGLGWGTEGRDRAVGGSAGTRGFGLVEMLAGDIQS